MYFFTADQHYGHENIIEYCDRPFSSIKEMDERLIENHNKVVGKGDVVIHAGDFSLIHDTARVHRDYVRRLNGSHIFLRGSHDYWLPKGHKARYTKTIEGQYIVVDHYAGRVWARSHHNSWQLHGHSHGGLIPDGKQWDVGVDNNYFYPVSWDEVVEIMKKLKDNFNLVKRSGG